MSIVAGSERNSRSGFGEREEACEFPLLCRMLLRNSNVPNDLARNGRSMPIGRYG